MCNKCGLVYVNPREEDFTAGDGNIGRGQNWKLDELLQRVRALRLIPTKEEEQKQELCWKKMDFEHKLKELYDYQPEGRLLDVGCERGFFLQIAKNRYEVYGVEPHFANSSYAREEFGLNVKTGTLLDVKYPDCFFDVVTMYHVIEHLPSPSRELREINRILKPGGILAVECPNIDNLWVKFFRERWREFIPDHYFFFSPKTLNIALRKVGFHTLAIRPAKRITTICMLFNRLGKYAPLLSSVLVGFARKIHVDELTICINISDLIIAYARKCRDKS
jgi:2-polyprenyl-3-methyl-5-hydroxy-6-metoxy-1,4-benzoquinol methylase